MHRSLVLLAALALTACGSEDPPLLDQHTDDRDLPPCDLDLYPPDSTEICGDEESHWWYRDGPELEGCTNIPGRLHVPDHPLENPHHLFALRSIGSLTFFRNSQMTSLQGLENLVSAGRFGLHLLDDLTDVTALASLCEVTDILYVSGNLTLTSLDGMNRVHTVGDLSITHNDSLTSLNGLSGLHTVHGDLRIESNSRLSQSRAEAFADRLTVGGEITITNNGYALPTPPNPWPAD